MHKLHLKHVAAVLALCLPILTFGAERQVVDIAVKGMTCPFCAYGLEKNLVKASEVEQASASLKEQKVHIVLKPGAQPDIRRYKQLIHDAGFTPGEAKVSKEEVK
ncbi:heavy metal-associated domain-containing protein [Chitinivorax sp. PXF-14]|uniref:Heavy-metal-associated domain-containing protein n=1 Tax=Burkholderia cepacia TaxID=292 RepID=A0A8I1AJY0_BURCE|nr:MULTISPECIES: heavy metal-associated domain-containing protein [Burkholderiaceae]MBB0025169.1 heavy-metal-associated domain-containing protein [Ralstonia pickettii]MBB0035957.1 heavy-metal-associated domain-containing protein [Ralstonia pickettii]MBB0098497.1 heavy-metal-associated domain-containing protein [Ralstonia pickettii]MBB0108444.1 heavy-metal-associated domain-containing protein [Ralstonia pickettii]MBB0129271.1 heavy-metal-associated domain-containing protein [Ralstonia pickettii